MVNACFVLILGGIWDGCFLFDICCKLFRVFLSFLGLVLLCLFVSNFDFDLPDCMVSLLVVLCLSVWFMFV